jgi:hypothetical protein
MARIERDRAPDVDADAPVLPAAPYLNVLSISSVPKQVPYEGTGLRRPDGRTNFGFTNLKEHPETIDAIPELAADAALRSLLEAIGRPETDLFAIACDSRAIADERGSRRSGYVELAFNCRDRVADPGAYFHLFLDFERRLRRRGFAEPISFQWEVCPTRFTDAGVDGFAVDVRVDTGFHEDPEVAYQAWTRALAALEELAAGVRPTAGAPIYARRS